MKLKIFDNLLNKRNEIEELNIPLKERIITFIFSVLMSLITVIGPIGIIINLAILDNYKLKLYVFLITTLLLIFTFLIRLIYLKGITKGKVKKLYFLYLPEIIFYSFVLYLTMIILFVIGVF